MDNNRQLRESLSWRLVTELWRRFPDRFLLIETHPCSGMYDCLTLWSRNANKGVLDVNREGSVHVHGGAQTGAGDHVSWSDWVEKMLAESPDLFLDEVTVALRLPVPKHLPSSTETTIAYRFVAEFLTHTIGRRERWQCRNGCLDTSGYGGGQRDEWFAQFPDAATLVATERCGEAPFGPSYFYWFLLKDDVPMICLRTDGTLFTKQGSRHELLPLYRQKNRIWPVINVVAGDLLP